MDDDRVWRFEEDLWTGPPEVYEERVDRECQMALPAAPFLFSGTEAIEAVKRTPRWARVTFSGGRISRPVEGWIVIAYSASAERDDGRPAYEAHCTSTYRRIAHGEWRVVQHSQTLAPLAEGASREERFTPTGAR